jgi:hypothetical protein
MLKLIKVKKTPAKARVLAVRESTISGRLQLPVYLHLWWKSNIIMPDHLALHSSSPSEAERLSGAARLFIAVVPCKKITRNLVFCVGYHTDKCSLVSQI